MKPIFLLFSVALLVLSCKNNDKVPSKVYCQGWVVKVIEQNASHEELSRSFTLHCNGDCPDGKHCDSLFKNYDPAKPGGLIKEQWCGCKGDTMPMACDVVLRTFRTEDGRIIQQADCTPFNTCPAKTDSCIQQPDKDTKTDTLRSVDGKDSIYRFTGTITCECMNRKGD